MIQYPKGCRIKLVIPTDVPVLISAPLLPDCYSVGSSTDGAHNGATWIVFQTRSTYYHSGFNDIVLPRNLLADHTQPIPRLFSRQTRLTVVVAAPVGSDFMYIYKGFLAVGIVNAESLPLARAATVSLSISLVYPGLYLSYWWG